MKYSALCGLALTIIGGMAVMLHLSHNQSGAPSSRHPYAGQDGRAISSLTAQDVAGYRAGAGMGLAKPAELNGFPGPMHVLELSRELALTEAQHAKVTEAMTAVKSKARDLGEKYIAAELAVDEAFRSGASREVIAQKVAVAGAILAELRFVHLDAHLEITPLLSSTQRTRYAQLRGYGSEPLGSARHQH